MYYFKYGFGDKIESTHFGSGKGLGCLLLEVAGSAFHDGLDLHPVAWISDHDCEVTLHALLGQSERYVHVGPELGLWVGGGGDVVANFVHANGGHDSVGGEEA